MHCDVECIGLVEALDSLSYLLHGEEEIGYLCAASAPPYVHLASSYYRVCING